MIARRMYAGSVTSPGLRAGVFVLRAPRARTLQRARPLAGFTSDPIGGIVGMDHPSKITFAQMREQGVRRVVVRAKMSFDLGQGQPD